MMFDLKVLESINLTLVVNLAVDYVVHLAQAYAHSPRDGRLDRTQHALEQVGVSVLDRTQHALEQVGVSVLDRTQHALEQVGVSVLDRNQHALDQVGVSVLDRTQHALDQVGVSVMDQHMSPLPGIPTYSSWSYMVLFRFTYRCDPLA